MSISLMTMRRFAPLFWCQFFAAFGDNFLKTALVFVILYEVAGANSAALISLAGATLIAPFFLLSGLGRELPSGNALIEGGTFLAILIGTIVAGIAANGNSNPVHFAWLMILTALASWLASLLIPKSGEGAPDLAINRNVLVST